MDGLGRKQWAGERAQLVSAKGTKHTWPVTDPTTSLCSHQPQRFHPHSSTRPIDSIIPLFSPMPSAPPQSNQTTSCHPHHSSCQPPYLFVKRERQAVDEQVRQPPRVILTPAAQL